MLNMIDRHADYLSSIEILIIDQMDALTMQNWEHVKVVRLHVPFFFFHHDINNSA